MTKLDDEIRAVRKTVVDSASELRTTIDSNAPHWLINIINNVLWDDRTPWFMLGMAFEALGITAFLMLNMFVLPIVDFIVGAVLALILLYFQGKHAKGELE